MIQCARVPGIVWRACFAVAVVAPAILTGCNQSSGPVAPGTNVSPGQAANPFPSGTATAPGQTAAAPAPAVDAAQNAANKAQYDQSLAQASLERAYKEIQQKYTLQRMAIVVVNGVPGPQAEADHYLERKLFKAAYADYEAGRKNADQQTAANREAAKQKAIADQQQQWGNSGIGPMHVWYSYKPVDSDVPYPEVRGGGYGTGQHVYYVGPVIDLAQFAARIKVGNTTSTDQGTRTLTIQSFIPSPIPDIDEEELYIQHGRENVVTIDVTGAEGDADRVAYFLERQLQAMQSAGDTFTVVGPRVQAAGRFKVFVAPVKDLNSFAAKVNFGSIADLNPTDRKLSVAAKIPAELPARPTAAELAEMRRKEWAGDQEPKDGESEIDWAIRVLRKGDDVTSARKVLAALTALKVDPTRLEDVGDALVHFGTNSTWAWHVNDDLLRAIDAWGGDKTTRYLTRKLAESNAPWDRKAYMQALAKHPTEEGARAVAALMTDAQVALDASAALRDMGETAEDVVLKLAQDRFPSMRAEAYNILREIGTPKALSKLKSSVTKEKDKDARETLKSVIADLEERHGGGEKSPFKAK